MGNTNGPAGGTIQAQPAVLSGASATSANGGSTANNVLTDSLNVLNNVLSALSPLAGEPYIGQGVTALMTALDGAALGLKGSGLCFVAGMNVISQGLEEAARLFPQTDSSLAQDLSNLESLLPQITGFAPPATLITPTQAEIVSLRNALNGQATPLAVTVANLNLNVPPPPHPSFWDDVGHVFSSGWHFVTQHPLMAGLTVLAIAATPFTGGGSDAAVGAADAAAVAADAADATSVAADGADIAAGGTAAAAGGTEAVTGGTSIVIGTMPSTAGATLTAAQEAEIQAMMDNVDAEWEALNKSLTTAG